MKKAEYVERLVFSKRILTGINERLSELEVELVNVKADKKLQEDYIRDTKIRWCKQENGEHDLYRSTETWTVPRTRCRLCPYEVIG